MGREKRWETKDKKIGEEKGGWGAGKGKPNKKKNWEEGKVGFSLLPFKHKKKWIIFQNNKNFSLLFLLNTPPLFLSPHTLFFSALFLFSFLRIQKRKSHLGASPKTSQNKLHPQNERGEQAKQRKNKWSEISEKI